MMTSQISKRFHFFRAPSVLARSKGRPRPSLYQAVISKAPSLALSSSGPISNCFSTTTATKLPPGTRSTNNAVERIRKQQLIKENDQMCREIISTSKFILFSGGSPFLYKIDERNRSPRLATYDQIKGLFKAKEGLENSSVFVRLSDEANCEPLFALSVPKNDEKVTENIEKNLQGKFTNMRAALFLLPSEWSGVTSGASSLLRWVKC